MLNIKKASRTICNESCQKSQQLQFAEIRKMVSVDPAWNILTCASQNMDEEMSKLIAVKIMNSDLVTVHNQEENVFIQHRHFGDRSWIGLNGRSVEGSFVWSNKEINSFRFWAPKQPNNWNNEDSVHTLGVSHGYTWNDVPCDNCFNFTCFTGDKSLA